MCAYAWCNYAVARGIMMTSCLIITDAQKINNEANYMCSYICIAVE